MSFSYNDFVKAKKKGQIAWDEDLINSFSQQTNDAAKSTEGLRPRDFDENKKKVTDLEQNRQYVQTYIDSLKGSEGYDAAKKSFDSVNDSFNKTKGFYDQFKDRKAYDTYVGESYLQGKQVKSELIRAASQAEIAGYEKRYEGKTYKELKSAAASAKDEKEKSWLNKRAEETATAQEYYNDNIAGIEKKKSAATARLNELQQSPNPLGLTIDRQREYSAIGKEIEGYDSELAKLNKVYKKKVSKETENEERKISARYAHKYEGKTVSDLLEARKTVEGESESEWLKNKILNNASYDELSSLKESMKKTTDSDFEGFSDFNSYYFYGDNTGLSKNQKAKYGITAEEIDSALEQKGEEEYYNDILKKDTKAITKVQRYYALKNGKIGFKSDGTVGETGGNEDVADSYVEGQYKSKNNNALESEKAKIIQDFEDLKAQGYDADKMLTYYSRIKENEDAENKLASIEQKTKKDPVGMSVASVPANMVGSIVDSAKLIAANVGRSFGGDGYYNPKTTQNKAAETIRNTVSQMINENISDETLSQTAQFLYQTGMSMGDMVSAVAVNSIPYVGPALSSAMFFTSSGVSNANRVIENGGTLDDATKTFVATGSAELFFESVSLEQLKAFKQQGVSKVSDAVKNTLKATFTEGSEELFTDVCNAITDQVINGDLSELSTKYKNYKKQGMSDDEAASAVAGEFATQLGLSFAGGALSGAVIGGAENTVLYTGSKIDDKKMIAAQYQQAAQELSEDAKYESVKKDLIEQAKNSGDAKAVKMAISFEKTVQRHNGDYSAITVTDVGNLMQVLDGADTTQTADNAEATQRSGNTAANAKEAPSAVGSAMDQAQRAATNTQYRAMMERQFTDSGQKKSTAGVNLNAFGKNHADGVRVVEKLNPEVTHDIVRIESSAKEYGNRDNTVTLLTADGKYINADDVQMPTAEQDTLIREAVNFNTNGARALMANYDGYADYCKQNGTEVDVHEYIKQFDALYRLGETGVRYESLQKVGSPRYNKIASIIGAEQAQNALNAGANDVDATFMHESNMRQKVRIPGQKNTAQSKVSVEVGEDFTRAFDDGFINTLQAIAVKTGRDIVLTDKLEEGDNGLFGNDGRIYINANIENSNYAIGIALHEAIHSARDVAPMEYLSLERFIVNYLTEKGENIDKLLYDIAKKWGEDVRDNYGVREELVAQTVMALASDENALRTAIECKENKNLLDKALDALKRIAASVKEFMIHIVKDGKVVHQGHNEQAQAWLKDAEALEQLAQRFSELMDEARTEMEESGQKNNTHGVRYSIEDINGKKYVKADRKVLTGDNPNQWKNQIEDYINKCIRHGEDVVFPTIDGHILVLTERSAYKLSDQHVSSIAEKNNVFLDDEKYYQKGIIATHIDEIIQVAQFRNYKEDENNKHENDIGEDGFNYFSAFFMDFDNKYYKVKFSAAINDENETAYSIGRAEKRKFPRRRGSSSNNEALQSGREFSNTIIYTTDNKSQEEKTTFQLAFEKALKKNAESNAPDGRKSKDDTIDADYLSAVERGDTETAQRMVDEAAQAAGYDLHLYHGSKSGGGFTVFKDWQYFTANQAYAERYTQHDTGKGMYNVYVKSSRMFDTRNADDHDLFERYRSEYGMSELQDSGLPDWTDGYDLSEIIEENDLDYDGIVLDEGGDLVNGKPVSRGESYVIRNSSQIKSADPVTYDDEGDVIPLSERFKTENKDIRYSKDDTIYDNRNLVAIHNLSEEKLMKSMKLGGLPMPSIAVTKHDSQHTGFGEISLIFGKDTINPDVNSENKVYSGDAWTPMYPTVEYEADSRKSAKLYERAREAVKDGEIEFFNPVSLHPDNIEDRLNRSKGESGLKADLKKDYGFRNLFLKETTGESVSLKKKESKSVLSQDDIEEYSFLYDQMPQGFDDLQNMSGKDWLAKYGESFRAAREAYIKQFFPDISEEQLDNAIGYEKGFKIVQRARKILDFHENGAETITVQNDIEGTHAEIDSKIDEKAYEKWLDEMLAGIEKNAGIQNGVDPYYSNGNRRSFSATHYTETLENVVRAMKQQRNGESFFPAAGIFGVAAKNYGTFDSMKADSSRIQSLSDEEYDSIKNSFGERFSEIAGNIAENGRQLSDNRYINLDYCFENILDGVRETKTKSGLVRYLKKIYGDVITDSVANDILDLIADVGNMPTKYFEAKPQRAVGFDEVKAAVVPSSASDEVKTALKNAGITIHEYEKGNEGSRAKATQDAISTEYTDSSGQSYEDLRFSKDDTIDSDLFDIDDDLFEEENKNYLDEMIKTDPNGAVMAMYNSLAKTGESVLKGFQGVRLSDENYLKIARRLMKRYEIKLKYNPGFDKKFAADIQRFVDQFKDHPNIYFEEALNTLCSDCKGYLLLSGDFSDVFKEQRTALMDMLRGGTLILENYAADQILENYGGIKNLRRAFLGKAFVGFQRDKAKYKKPLDPLEVVEQFRDMFGYEWVQDDDLDSFECWRWLDDTLNGRLQPKYINPFINGERAVYQSIDTASAEMGMEILSELINEKSDAASKSKTADKKTIRELNEQQEKGTSKKVEYLRAQKEKYQKLAEEEKQKRLMKGTERDAYRKKVASLEDENRRYKGLIYTEEQTVRQQYIEAREKVRYRKLLAKELGRMTKMLDGKANNNVYIPDKLKKPILNVLNLFEVLPDNGQQLPQYWSQFRNLKDVGNRIDELTTEYRKLSTGGVVENIFGDQFNADNLAYDEAVEDALRFLADNVKGKNVYALNAEELRNIYEGMRMLDAQLKRAVQVIVDGKTEYIDELAGQAVDEVEKVHFNKGGNKNALAMLRNAAVATHLDPVRYGRFLSGYHDDYVIAKLFKDLHNGDKKRVKIIYQAFTELERTLHETFSDKELKQLQTKDNEEFSFTDLKTGKRVKVSDAVLVSLYLTNAQADGHRQLVNDKANHYTVLPDLDAMNRDKLPVVGDTIASLTHAHQKATGEAAHHVRLSKFDMEQINEYIDNNRKLSKLCDAVSGVFNGVIKDEINKVSLQRYGKMIATVKDYYPLSTYKQYAGKKFEVEVGESLKDVRLKSRSFTKQRTHAYNALVIDDVFNVFLKHVQETAEYCGMLIPVENFKRVYGKGNDKIVLSKAIEDKFGGSAGHYIKKLMDDIQKPKDTIDQNFLTRMHGNYMGAVLMLNPGAALKQFAAYPTAFKYFGIGNVSKSIPMGFAKGKGLVEKYSAYTPYMWYRENGNGTVVAEVSKQLSITSKANNWLDIMGKTDRLVVNSLLYAAEEHVRKTRTDLTYDSEAFKQEVAAQFERAIDESQPNNMITSKPQFVRNNALRLLNFNAFLSQNMAMGNGIIDSGMELAARIHEHNESKTEESAAAMKQSALRFISHMLGVGLSAALLSFLKQIADLLIYHKWDDTKDEEGKTDWNKIADRWWNDFFDAYTGAFAQGDKIFSAIKVLMGAEKWQDMEVFSLGTINDIMSNAGNGKYSKALFKLLDATGVPATNASRLWNGLYHTFFDLWDGNTYPVFVSDHTIFKNNGELDTKHLGFYVVSYMKNGDKAEAEKYENLWKAELMKGGKSESKAMDSIKSDLAAALAATDADVTNAFVAYQNGNMAEYDKLFDKLTGYGFDPSDVDKAIESVKTLTYKEMKERGVTQKDAQADLMEQGFTEEAAEKLAEGYEKPEEEAPESAFDDSSKGAMKKYVIKDGITALKNGDKATYEKIKQYVVEHNDKIADNEEFDKKMKSTTYTGGIIQNYLDALDSGKDKERETYQQQLVNIYGSWSEAAAAINRYRKARNKK